MTTEELNNVIRELCRPAFSHVSKTYIFGEFINVAWKREKHTINIYVSYEVAQHIIKSLRK